VTRARLDKISSQSFEHPSDRAALEALKKTVGFERAVRALARLGLDKEIHLREVSSHVRVGPKQVPKLFKLYTEVCDTLDLEPPPLYLANDAQMNAYCTGIESPLLVVTAGLLGAMTDTEVQCVLGHELGHFLSGHVLYRLIAENLRAILLGMGAALGVQTLLEIAIAPPLFYWYRCSELTADRCGVLAVQEPRTQLSCMMKLAGGLVGRFAAELDLDAFLEQTKYVEIEQDTWSKVTRAILDANLTHPWPVVRAKELQKWIDSGDYEKIQKGEYIRRAGDVIADGPHPAKGEETESGIAAAAEVAILVALARAYGVHVAPRIPEQALHLALGSYVEPLLPDERVLALYDETFSGTGDRGVVLTNRRLFAHVRPKQGIAFSKVTKLEDVPGGLLSRPGLLVDDLEIKFHTRDVRDAFKSALAAAVEVHRA
jgi:hypothetical protein